jgi:translation initiation factor 1A
MPNDDELFAIVTQHDGGNHVVLVEPWDWQDEKANIEWRYTGRDADQLRREGHIGGL